MSVLCWQRYRKEPAECLWRWGPSDCGLVLSCWLALGVSGSNLGAWLDESPSALLVVCLLCKRQWLRLHWKNRDVFGSPPFFHRASSSITIFWPLSFTVALYHIVDHRGGIGGIGLDWASRRVEAKHRCNKGNVGCYSKRNNTYLNGSDGV